MAGRPGGARGKSSRLAWGGYWTNAYHAIDAPDLRFERYFRLSLGETAGSHNVDGLVQQREGLGAIAEQAPTLCAIEQADVALHAGQSSGGEEGGRGGLVCF